MQTGTYDPIHRGHVLRKGLPYSLKGHNKSPALVSYGALNKMIDQAVSRGVMHSYMLQLLVSLTGKL